MGLIAAFANPARFMALSRWLAPLLGVVAAALLASGLWMAMAMPDDYQQGATVRILPLHIAAAYMSLFCYACLAGASFFGLVFRHSLADAAAKAAAPLGAIFTALCLATGSLWARPMWGTWWVWDGRLTSVFILFLIYLGYMALHAAIDDEAKAARAAAILALVGVVNLPIIHFSVEWWNTLHQGATLITPTGPKAPPTYLWPAGLIAVGYMTLFGALWLVRIRSEVWRRRAGQLAMAAAG
jgi:heme exporter protein C